MGFWLPHIVAAYFLLLHLAAWAIVVLRVPMEVIPTGWVWGAVEHVAWLVWFTWLVM